MVVFMRTIKSLLSGFITVCFLIGITCTKEPTAIDMEEIVWGTMTDIEGNMYKTVKIGNQEWMAENLRVTKYNDGGAISKTTSDSIWAACSTSYIPTFCYFENTTDTNGIIKYGALYNGYVVDPTNPKKIAPAGWHVPTDADWTVLENYLIANGYNHDSSTTGNKIAKSLAAQTDWILSTNDGAPGNNLNENNRSGFSALPTGYRNYDGLFYLHGHCGLWWSATETDALSAYLRDLHYDYKSLYRYGFNNDKSCGFSVRLLRD
jgi:uncharacterized protein (TIGR02145 family)